MRWFDSLPILFLYCVAALCYGFGGAAMKASDGLRQPIATILQYVCFAAGVTIQAVSLRRGELGTAYVVVLGLEGLVAVGLGVALYGEALSGMKAVAMGLILTGIFLLH